MRFTYRFFIALMCDLIHYFSLFSYDFQSTTWVKKESEKAAKLLVETTGESSATKTIDLSKCFLEDADGGNARYETHCIDDYVKNLEAKESPKLVEVEETVTESDSEEENSSEDDDETSSETESEL